MEVVKIVMMALVGFALVFSFVGGATMLCKHSDGEIVGFTCVGLQKIGLCESAGRMHLIPNQNNSIILQAMNESAKLHSSG